MKEGKVECIGDRLSTVPSVESSLPSRYSRRYLNGGKSIVSVMANHQLTSATRTPSVNAYPPPTRVQYNTLGWVQLKLRDGIQK